MIISKSAGLSISNICFHSRVSKSHGENLADCFRQLSESAAIKEHYNLSIIKQTIFISVSNNSEYHQAKSELLKCAGGFFEKVPPTSVISQAPENGTLVVEFIMMEGLQEHKITYRENEDISWLVIDRNGLKMLVATACSENSSGISVPQSCDSVFRSLQKILRHEKMEFSDVVRQWNYIEQITLNVNHNNTRSQNYQVFNDVRSRYYDMSEFKNGFPAATGIGTAFGGITIDIIAAKFIGKYSVTSIKSPVQLDAYAYSDEVLAENNSMKDYCRTTPKFERAKVLSTPENKVIFISGTAAIKGQASIPVMSVKKQTELTIQNILSLISTENLEKHGLKSCAKAEIIDLRVYVRHEKEIREVKEICLKYFPGISVVFLTADICRPELLVEIEGKAALL